MLCAVRDHRLQIEYRECPRPSLSCSLSSTGKQKLPCNFPSLPTVLRTKRTLPYDDHHPPNHPITLSPFPQSIKVEVHPPCGLLFHRNNWSSQFPVGSSFFLSCFLFTVRHILQEIRVHDSGFRMFLITQFWTFKKYVNSG